MNLAFRVDSSNLIGAGHVRRCLKLAEDLKYKCNKIIFITKFMVTATLRLLPVPFIFF